MFGVDNSLILCRPELQGIIPVCSLFAVTNQRLQSIRHKAFSECDHEPSVYEATSLEVQLF